MKALIESHVLYVKETGTGKGRGVFARRSFAQGDIVEIAPVLVLKTDYESLPAQLKTYVFDWTALTGAPGRQGLVLGYGSLYNHGNPSNLRYEADARQGVMRYVAAQPIAAHEELTINYSAQGGATVSDGDDWFDRMGIELIKSDRI